VFIALAIGTKTYNNMTRRYVCASWLLLAIALCVMCMSGCQQLKTLLVTRPSEKLPPYHPVTDIHYLGQNWSAVQRQRFYHTGQGTELVPYSWFMALEQPKIKVFGTVPKFRETSYLARFGFLPDPISPENPDGLPVGFAKDTVVDPDTGQTVEVVGFTCAACHTGQLEYQGKGIRIEGGSSTADLLAFQTELGYAVGFTDKIPFRFDRFAKAVLGENASDDAKRKLRQEFEAFLNKGLAEKNAADAGNIYPAASEGGFGRTDALGRIGNFVFGTELDNANLRVADAPVSFPPLWYASWFAWVQYNASIQQPMVRNIGEALGVRARVNLTDPKKLYNSTVNVKNLWEIENLLAGPTAFTGLRSPVWPEQILGPIDQAKAQKGAELYRKHCQHCHLPPLDSPEIQQPQYWEAGLDGHRFLQLNEIPLEEIGTDPKAAANWQQRRATPGALGSGTISAADGLSLVTGKIRDMKYDELGLSAKERSEWNGFRDDKVTAPLKYRARPLGGMWATPPFLHNGSVPNLYQMLVPADQRDKTFYVGNREFDPKYVGFSTAKFEGGFEFHSDQPDDPHPGNSNAGHEFRNGSGQGVIGPELSDEERWALIEYLKAIGQPAK
jgi:mono/diheme cytochrome c family protein